MRRLFGLFILAVAGLAAAACGEKFSAACGVSEISQTGINFVQPTIQAMEQYRKDNGKYPNDVFDLVPKYIEKIPIVLYEKGEVDETKYNILIHEKLRGGVPRIYPNENSFSIEFTPTDDRVCLTGRNNLCEYSSVNKSWNCHQ